MRLAAILESVRMMTLKEEGYRPAELRKEIQSISAVEMAWNSASLFVPWPRGKRDLRETSEPLSEMR